MLRNCGRASSSSEFLFLFFIFFQQLGHTEILHRHTNCRRKASSSIRPQGATTFIHAAAPGTHAAAQICKPGAACAVGPAPLSWMPTAAPSALPSDCALPCKHSDQHSTLQPMHACLCAKLMAACPGPAQQVSSCALTAVPCGRGHDRAALHALLLGFHYVVRLHAARAASTVAGSAGLRAL